MEFESKVALVTGAAGAIGKAIAEHFCRQGARVFITDLDQTKIDQCCSGIDPSGRLCKGLAADVTEHQQVINVVRAALSEFGGKIDILVNVAGIVAQGNVEDIDERTWDQVFAVNCKGTFLFIKEVVPVMKENGSGKIINFSSKSGKTGSALMSHYSAAKAAIIGLTQSLAYELAGFSINVNCICPGITENTGVWDNVSSGYVRSLKMPMDQIVEKFTTKVPLGRLAKVEDVVAVTCFLASKGADYMTGQAINVTGGREMH
ncbi:MAG: SDR family oxidoreductase [Planctomycetes bacterium]|nr:SDR family oxidoreductase [Planctomycetota bacterium]